MATTAPALRFNSRFNAPFFAGVAASPLVPGKFPCALDGRPYQLIWDKEAIEVWGAKYKSIAQPLLRAQADQSNTPGEQSISPENFWRRSQENWVSGGGQTHQDRKGNSDTRFNSTDSRFMRSTGIDPWTPFQATLLNTTSQIKLALTPFDSNLKLATTDTALYFMETSGVSVSFDGSTWSAVTGFTGTPQSICSDGSTVYLGTSTALYAISGTVASSYVPTVNVSVVEFVKGRLMIASGSSIYNITGAGALPAALYTKTGWTWNAFAGGQSMIYATVTKGNQSTIYRTGILADGTSLAAPISAGELPAGETTLTIYAYQGYILIGTTKGTRFCSVASDGSLNIGALIHGEGSAACYAFEGQDRFVWFGQSLNSSYNSQVGNPNSPYATSIMRMDLTTFTSTALTPAYTTDLAAPDFTTGTPTSIKTFQNRRVFTLGGSTYAGVYIENLYTPVAFGTLTTGFISYNLIDDKVALFLDIAHLPLTGSIAAEFAVDSNGYTGFNLIGTSAAQGTMTPPASFQVNQKSGFQFQIRFTLKPDGNGNAPTLTRWTLRSYPTPIRSSQFHVPLDLSPVVDINGREEPFDVVAELKHLRTLLATQQIVIYQEGKEVYQVVMYDYQWLPRGVNPKTGYMYGIFYVVLNQVTS